jgi:hypothetical protein
MIACLIVHCFAFGAGFGLLAGPSWIGLGIAIGAAIAIWDEVKERRSARVIAVTRARRGSGG